MGRWRNETGVQGDVANGTGRDGTGAYRDSPIFTSVELLYIKTNVRVCGDAGISLPVPCGDAGISSPVPCGDAGISLPVPCGDAGISLPVPCGDAAPSKSNCEDRWRHHFADELLCYFDATNKTKDTLEGD